MATAKAGVDDERYRNALCSFCRKSFREVGPLVEGEGPGDVFICANCVDLCQNVIDQEKWRRTSTDPLAYFRIKLDRIARLAADLKVEMDPQILRTLWSLPPGQPGPDISHGGFLPGSTDA
jgi:hypothetical protein